MKIQSVASAIDSSESNVSFKSESDPVSESEPEPFALAEWLMCAVPTAIKFEHRTQDNTQDTQDTGQRAQLQKKEKKKRRCGINEKQLTCSANKQTRHNNYAKKEAAKDNRRHAAATTTTIAGSTYVPAYQDNYGDSDRPGTEGQHSAAFRA